MMASDDDSDLSIDALIAVNQKRNTKHTSSTNDASASDVEDEAILEGTPVKEMRSDDGTDAKPTTSPIRHSPRNKSNQLDNASEDKSSTPKPSVRDINAEKKKKQIEWAKRMTIDQVTFTAEGDNVESLGSRKWMELSVDVMKAFMKQNNITSAQNLRSKGDLGKNVANSKKAQGYKNEVKGALQRSSSSKNKKPECITVEGTLYRVINVIMLNTEDFMNTWDSHDKDDTDTRSPKPVSWQHLHNSYDSKESKLKVISPSAKDDLLGYSVSGDVAETWDKLTVEELKEVMGWIMGLYRKAMNAKTVSGFHGNFGVCTQGKPFLLYLYKCLEESGDASLQKCAYPELEDNVKRSSSDSKPRARKSRSGSTASERSLSPNPNADNFRSKKYSAVDATEGAAHAYLQRDSRICILVRHSRT